MKESFSIFKQAAICAINKFASFSGLYYVLAGAVPVYPDEVPVRGGSPSRCQTHTAQDTFSIYPF